MSAAQSLTRKQVSSDGCAACELWINKEDHHIEEEYAAACEACDTETQVLVLENEEEPRYCPMCGTPLEYDECEDW